MSLFDHIQYYRVLPTDKHFYDLDRLPTRYRVTGSLGSGLWLLFIGIVFGLEPAVHLIQAITHDGLVAVTWTDLGWSVFGLWFALLGLDQLLIEGELVVRQDHVQCTYRSLLGRRSWREPVSGFRGLRGRIEAKRGADQSLAWRIWMLHRKRGRSLLLWSDGDDERMREALERYQRMFGLPVVE